MEPFSIAALVASVVGAGMQYKASTDAQERQQREIRAGLDSQRALQLQAEKKSTDAASKFETPKRQEEQAQIADQITADLMAPVSESQAIRSSQQTTQGNVSSDYTTAKAASDLNAIKSAQNLARMMGKTSSANRLRMNEGIRLMDTGQDIDRLANFSSGQAGADGVAIQQAGMVNPGQVFMGSLLQAGGSAGLMSGGSGTSVYAANEAPTIAGSPGLAPVYDISKVGTAGGSSFANAFNTKANSLYNWMAK